MQVNYIQNNATDAKKWRSTSPILFLKKVCGPAR
jgi:hypothetical protein